MIILRIVRNGGGGYCTGKESFLIVHFAGGLLFTETTIADLDGQQDVLLYNTLFLPCKDGG